MKPCNVLYLKIHELCEYNLPYPQSALPTICLYPQSGYDLKHSPLKSNPGGTNDRDALNECHNMLGYSNTPFSNFKQLQ